MGAKLKGVKLSCYRFAVKYTANLLQYGILRIIVAFLKKFFNKIINFGCKFLVRAGNC